MSVTGRDGDKCACGNSYTVGKCERAQRETAHSNWEEVERKSGSVLGVNGKRKVLGIQRTEGETINPLGLPEETVDLVHLVHSSFRPAFFCNH